MCVGRVQAEEGVEHRVKTQIWSNHPLAHVVKFRLEELPRPSTFSQPPANQCLPWTPHWSHTSPPGALTTLPSLCLGAEFLQLRTPFCCTYCLVDLLLVFQGQFKSHSLYEESRVKTYKPEEVKLLYQNSHSTVRTSHWQFLPCSILANCLKVLFFLKTLNIWRLKNVLSIHLNVLGIYGASVAW